MGSAFTCLEASIRVCAYIIVMSPPLCGSAYVHVHIALTPAIVIPTSHLYGSSLRLQARPAVVWSHHSLRNEMNASLSGQSYCFIAVACLFYGLSPLLL